MARYTPGNNDKEKRDAKRAQEAERRAKLKASSIPKSDSEKLNKYEGTHAKDVRELEKQMQEEKWRQQSSEEDEDFGDEDEDLEGEHEEEETAEDNIEEKKEEKNKQHGRSSTKGKIDKKNTGYKRTKKEQETLNRTSQKRTQNFKNTDNQLNEQRKIDNGLYKGQEREQKRLAKQGTEKAAKKGAETAAKTGAKAGGMSGCGIVIAIIVAILLFIGMISFMNNMPDSVTGQLTAFWDDFWTGTKIWWGTVEPDKALAQQNLNKAAEYLDNMGYDLAGYGFLGELVIDSETELEIESGPIDFYTFDLGIDSVGIATYRHVYYNGIEVLDVSNWSLSALENNMIDHYVGIGMGSDDDLSQQQKIIETAYKAIPSKNILEGPKSRTITVQVVYEDEDKQNIKSIKDVLGKNEKGEVESVTSDVLLAYLAAEQRTYMYKGEYSAWWDGTWAEGIAKFFGGKGGKDIGMLDVDEFPDEIKTGDNKISIDRTNRNFYIPSGNKYYDGYNYDLNGWTGKYGKPFEFSIAMHLATMAPEFAYKVAYDSDLDTNVKMKVFNGVYSRKVLNAEGEDAETSLADEIRDAIDNFKFTPSRLETQEEANLRTGYVEPTPTEELEELGVAPAPPTPPPTPSERIEGTELSGWSAIYYALNDGIFDDTDTDMKKYKYEENLPDDWAGKYDELCEFLYTNPLSLMADETVESIQRLIADDLIKMEGMEGLVGEGVTDEWIRILELIEQMENYLLLIKVRAYNNMNANLPQYIPYIHSVENHWYRDLHFGDPQYTEGYVVDISADGAAPIINTAEGLKNVFNAYSNPTGKANLQNDQTIKNLLFIQEKYNVNAIFAAAVAIKEQSAGSADSTCNNIGKNWYSIQGSPSTSKGWKIMNWSDSVDGRGGTLHFGRLMSGTNTKQQGYFPAGNVTVGGIGRKYCVPPEGWIKGVIDIMSMFYKYAMANGIPLVDSAGNPIADFETYDTSNLLDPDSPTVYVVKDGFTNTIPAGGYPEETAFAEVGFLIQERQLYDIVQVREPIQYDSSAKIKTLLGYVDERIIESYEDGDKVNENNIQSYREKISGKAKYYIYNGVGRSSTKEPIHQVTTSLDGITMLESAHTEDAEHILKNFKELFNDIGFELEDSSKTDKETKENRSTSLGWIFKEYIPDYDWPSQDETPKTKDVEGKETENVEEGDTESGDKKSDGSPLIYIYKVSAGYTAAPDSPVTIEPEIPDVGDGVGEGGDENGTDVLPGEEETGTNGGLNPSDDNYREEGNGEEDFTDANAKQGFDGGEELVAPGNSRVIAIDRANNTLTIKFEGVMKTETYIQRTLTDVKEGDKTVRKYVVEEKEREVEDGEVNGLSLTIYGINIDSSLTENQMLFQGETIGKSIELVDIGLLLRGQDLTSSDEETDSAENLSKLSVPRYIYPPEKEEETPIGDYIIKTDAPGAAPIIPDAINPKTGNKWLQDVLDTYTGKDRRGTMINPPGNGKYVLNTEEVVKELYAIQKDYNVNAIFVASSSIWTCGGGRNMKYAYNLLNIIHNGPNSRYNSVQHCMEEAGKLINNSYFVEGRTTVTLLRQKWNPGAEKNKPPRSQQIIQQMTTFFLRAKDMGVPGFEDFVPPAGATGEFLELAKQCHDFMVENGKFTYNASGGKVSANYGAGKGNNGYKIDCSAYVTWVLYEYGYTNTFKTQKTSYWFKNSALNLFRAYGWQKITPVNKSTLQPGDILVVNNSTGAHHVEIYAGDGKSYSAGSNSSINSRTISTNFSRYDFAIRITPPSGKT